ncbi:putative beta-galactosidase [Aspergillus steynii IBT 23096]|uniref:Beta-galactosidase n=1 Tax=Aspergillus steynii IBT 23096 TaxID=1392250 RepID=A0A2I2G8X1_9EURO|nr:putative beta-galactosidase [Aspergillus steynii IBT 23096]PLB49336.1 putative beta-galactosidase [Aspergillus steynii IBT 23096]
MRLWHTLNTALALGLATPSTAQDWPLHDNGLNKVVQWDHYSIQVNGERLFLWSGELHLWRIPVPELWRDILEKIKAAGFNGIGLYEHWGWHAPNNETLDFETGAHDFAKAFELAKEIGLYVIYRPGPYSNAEANGGGFPGWLTTGEYGPLRDDSEKYTKAWTRYSKAVADYVRPYLITNGGPIIMWQIENEYGVQWLDPDLKTPNETAINYMELLQDSHREWGIDVPLTHNNPNMRTRSWSKDYSSVGGEVDMYGLDHYPACWTCDLDQCLSVSSTQPSFLMEFQGGSFNPWDGPAGGCKENMGPPWVNLFFRHNLAQKVSAVNIYMLYGGTNWGNIGFPEVGTSYDYSSPIHENRLIGDKFNEAKLFGLFMRSARDFTKVKRVANSTAYATDGSILTTELRNPDTGAAFYVVRHEYSPLTELTKFRLNVTTEAGRLRVPRKGSITINGTESKVLVTNFNIGSSSKKITYATLEVLTVSDLGDRQVVVFWAPAGEQGEFLINGAKWGNVIGKNSNDTLTKTRNGIVTNVVTGKESTVIDYDNDVQAVVVDRQSAYKFWAPTLDNNPLAWESSTVLVHGPYLIRTAKINGDTIHVTGDWNEETDLEIWAPKNVKHVTFNGLKVKVMKSKYASLRGTLPAADVTIESLAAELPPVINWKVAENLPETAVNYDDSNWTDADHMETPHFVPPDTYPVLFADEYGYQAGNILWRGRFHASEDQPPSGAYLRVIGGLASGFSAYINGEFLGSWYGSMANKTGELEVSFEDVTLHTTKENVLFVIQDTMGKEQREAAPDPRGILNATLYAADGSAANFSSWKVAGNAGGNHLLEPIRGTYNEGGLHAERLGWHLPGFDDSHWESGVPGDGFTGAGSRFYRTVVPLDIPRGYDVSLAFQLHTEKKAKLRAQLYVNGYQFAKTLPFISNERTFPVFPGILNYSGNNTVGLSVWAMEQAGGAVDVKWKVMGVHRSGFDPLFDGEYLRPGWRDRSQYA